MVREYKLSADGEKSLSAHFKVKEFACKSGNQKILIDDDLIEILESVRNNVARPIKITCGYRDEAYNQQCGGADNSYHLKGMACDIRCDGIGLTKLALICMSMGAKGCGIYKDQNFVHIDTRDIVTIFREE